MPFWCFYHSGAIYVIRKGKQRQRMGVSAARRKLPCVKWFFCLFWHCNDANLDENCVVDPIRMWKSCTGFQKRTNESAKYIYHGCHNVICHHLWTRKPGLCVCVHNKKAHHKKCGYSASSPANLQGAVGLCLKHWNFSEMFVSVKGQRMPNNSSTWWNCRENTQPQKRHGQKMMHPANAQL